MIQETKLNDTFTVAQFSTDSFKLYRNNYTEHVGRTDDVCQGRSASEKAR